MARSNECELRFETIYRQNYTRLYYYALNITGDEETAREEVMLRDYYLRHCASQPDVDAELAAFKGRHFRQGMPGMRRHLYRLVAGVAASVAVVILSYFIYYEQCSGGQC